MITAATAPGWISWTDLGTGTHTARALSASITRARIWREVLEFVRLPLPLLGVGRGAFLTIVFGHIFAYVEQSMILQRIQLSLTTKVN